MSLMWWTAERRFEMPDVISCSRTTNHSFNLRGKIKDQPQVSWSRDSMMSWHALAIRVKHASMQTCWPRLRLLINALSCEIVTWMVAKLTGRRRRRGEGGRRTIPWHCTKLIRLACGTQPTHKLEWKLMTPWKRLVTSEDDSVMLVRHLELCGEERWCDLQMSMMKRRDRCDRQRLLSFVRPMISNGEASWQHASERTTDSEWPERSSGKGVMVLNSWRKIGPTVNSLIVKVVITDSESKRDRDVGEPII